MKAVLASAAALVAALSSAPIVATAADKCPLHAASFMLVAHGQTGKVDRYVVALLLTGSDPVTANLQVPGLQNDITTPVIAPDAAGGESINHYAIDIPRAVSATGITVYGLLVHGRGDHDMTCRQPVRLVTTAPAGSLSQFDDSGLSPSDLLYPQRVTEAHILQSAPAAFPASDAQIKHPSTIVVALTVGAGGGIVAARIDQSSGYPSFDAAALSAARKTEFSAPQFDGHPIALEYFVSYRLGGR
ncbi:MAG TPA: TonB family protein [Candidatus Eremiobacteraceae bacterium]|nr:TonB family protein [Candidatus Eremiobacteraceae bacterium]